MYYKRNMILERINTGLLSLVAFSLAFDYKFTVYALLLSGFFIVFQAIKQKNKVNKKDWLKVLPFILFYVWYAIGFFYSEDKQNSFKDLETKFSLLALPILIGVFTKLSKKDHQLIFTFFIAGLVCMELTSLWHASVAYSNEAKTSAFLYHQLVALSDINAAYFSWFVLFSLTLLLFKKMPFGKFTLALLIIFQLGFLILLSSRAVQFSFVFVLVPIAFFYYREKINKLIYRASLGIFIALIALFVLQPSIVNKRFEKLQLSNAKQALLPEYDHHSYEFNDLSTRLFFWRVGIENIKASNIIIGVGNGDVNHIQNQRMHQLGIKNLYDEEQPSDFLNMNLHNMYIQSLLSSGIVGFSLFLSILFCPLLIAIRSKKMILFLFQLIAILFMFHESALQTQAGTVFYSFFAALLIGETKSTEQNKNEEENNPMKLSMVSKRTFDLIMAIILLLPFFFILLPICALLIKVSSKGPVFFVQKRTGMNKQVFNCYKLRTMHLNPVSDTQQAKQNDERVTKIGYFLRVMHIDEMPQLLNVLKGEMSIIGPRPHMLHHTLVYRDMLDFYDQRLKAKPGLTGLAQIKGYLGAINQPSELKRRVLNDIYYIKHSSWKLNAYILFMTINNIMRKFFSFKNRVEK